MQHHWGIGITTHTCDDHYGVGLGDYAFQEDDVGVLEQPHDNSLGDKVHLVRAARLEGLVGTSKSVLSGAVLGGGEAHIAELPADELIRFVMYFRLVLNRIANFTIRPKPNIEFLKFPEIRYRAKYQVNPNIGLRFNTTSGQSRRRGPSRRVSDRTCATVSVGKGPTQSLELGTFGI